MTRALVLRPKPFVVRRRLIAALQLQVFRQERLIPKPPVPKCFCSRSLIIPWGRSMRPVPPYINRAQEIVPTFLIRFRRRSFFRIHLFSSRARGECRALSLLPPIVASSAFAPGGVRNAAVTMTKFFKNDNSRKYSFTAK
jgi:hypothetical protein